MAGILQQSSCRGLSARSGFGPLSPVRHEMDELLERFTSNAVATFPAA